MKNILKKISNSLIPVLLLGVLAIACKKEVESLDPMRMFMPTGAINSISGEKQVKLTWNRSLYTTASSGVTYTVEVAADTMFQTPVILSVQSDTSGVVFTDDQLQVRQNYFARIKANALGDRPESKWVTSNSFRIRGEQIFEPVLANDVIENAAILKWRESPGLTKIVLTRAGGTPVEVALTDADKAARQKMIEGLRPSTMYTAEIFSNTQSRGTTAFSTKASTTVGNVIDLTAITGRPSVLADTIPEIPSGSTVLLKRGQTYTISSAVNISKSVTIMSENSFNPEMARLDITSNFNVTEGSVIDSIVFKNVTMKGIYSSNYVLNINKACTIGKLKFEGSRIDIFRGAVRLQAANINVNKFSVINSIVDSLSNYGVISIDNTGAIVNDILFSNSTFYKIERPVFSRTASRSILIENCTFNESPEATRYLVDYGSLNVSSGIKVVNSIFGIGKNLGGNRAGRGIRAGSTTLIESSGTYVTSDYEATSNAIPGVIVHSGSSFSLFQDPRNGNFRITDNAFAGRNTAGDPRWRQ